MHSTSGNSTKSILSFRSSISRRRKVTLPWDVIFYIADLVPAAHLHPLLLTCKALHTVAERVLYTHIDLANCPIRSLLFFRTILNQPDLARYVITFQTAERHAPLQGRWTRVVRRLKRSDSYYRRQSTYVTVAEQVTQHLTNVEALSVHGTTTQFVRRLSNLHSIKKFRTLHPYGLSQHEALFDALPLVTHLELPFTSLFISVADIRPDHCPCVEELVCPTNVAMRVVPDRPVRKLFLMFPILQTPPSPYDLMLQMSRSTAKITVLGMVVRYHWTGDMPELLRATGMFLPDVEELYLTLSFFRGEAQATETLLRTLPRDLEAFKSLRILDFSGSNGHGVIYFDPRRNGMSKIYLPVLEQWGAGSPTLSKVVFPNGTIWTRTSGSWRCQNQWAPKPQKARIFGRIAGAEPWTSKPMFKDDLVRPWPKNVDIKTGAEELSE